ncbi:MAG: energy transducer TonB [Acidobacteriota bacterium]|nr:energy transducer TonB [Acidobacteriota bacterium]
MHNPPEYPAVAKKLSIHGTVQLTLKVSADGMVKDVSVTGGNPVLVDASVKAVRQWRYEATGKESQEPVKFVF